MTKTTHGIYAPTEKKKRNFNREYKRKSPAREIALDLVKKVGLGGTIEADISGNLADALSSDGLSRGSASPTCTWLRNEGYIEYLGPSQNKVIKVPV